jgi:hypothetical protein
MKDNFLGNKLLLTLKMENLVQFFSFYKTVLQIV